MTIVASTYTEGATQQDGRRYVKERHTDDGGRVYEYEWLGAQDPAPVLAARAARLDELLAEQAAAQAQIEGTLLPLSKLKFRELFTTVERMGIDALNSGFEAHPGLTAEQKAAIRTGLEDYRMAEYIARPFDKRVGTLLGMYQAMGLRTAERVAEIMAAGNG